MPETRSQEDEVNASALKCFLFADSSRSLLIILSYHSDNPSFSCKERVSPRARPFVRNLTRRSGASDAVNHRLFVNARWSRPLCSVSHACGIASFRDIVVCYSLFSLSFFGIFLMGGVLSGNLSSYRSVLNPIGEPSKV